ncbi:hypothetical protein SAMN05519103_07688 [Rhizobiales bacterium GAS113]|jgi:uncharacterized protein YggU (UPF0235/DUF167 family)|nr:hypothetical protein SAMN05519103_07688 [Rhizobiales bacterium GAS113]
MSDAHLRLEVRLTPRAARDAIEGETLLSDGHLVLAARVRALPQDGAANEALIRLVAKTCGVPRARVSLVTGASSRLKTLRIDGDPVSLAASLGLRARQGQAGEPAQGRRA